MRLIFGLVLVLGMALAGFAVYMAKDYISDYQAELAAERAARQQMVETIEVYVSQKPLRYGEKLNPEDVRTVRWPVDALPEGIFKTDLELFPKGTEVLRTVIRAMEKDEAILAVKVTGPGEDAGVSSRLAKGMRAFAIRVDVSSGVSGFLRPGDRVDIYWTGQALNSNGDRRGNLTKLIQTTVRLLAIDQTADGERNNPSIARTVTVEATPLQVASLAQAQATGQLSLALVGAEDDEIIGAVEVDRNALLGVEERQVVAVEAAKVCSVRTRRGAEIIDTQIECKE
ncbi:MAG: Flp pilus assembly protein CpaB [Marinosulfonomonas sp.]|nr:Flp pilus assembly protein CpaB [Marinosulfonomonas sp.]